ncbi:MAG TPA: hypothetical protein VKN36_00080, partial [Eudoraea sp.]|nr:hypothetical protein [Eudoraea sp.]
MKIINYLSLLSFLVFGCNQGQKVEIVISNINVIDVKEGKVIHNQDVVIDRNQIIDIQDHDDHKYQTDQLINGGGNYLIPGFWDMHVHTQDPDLYSKLYIANGITGIRDMGGNDPFTRAALSDDFKNIAQWREDILKGELLGPRVIAARSIIDGPPGFWPALKVVSNEKEAIATVQADKQAGADFIKVYSLLREREFKAVAEE